MLLADVTTLPYGSSIEAWRPKPLSAVTLAEGTVVTTTCDATAGVTVIALVMPKPRPLAETSSVYLPRPW